MSGRVLIAVLSLPAVAIVARICFAEWSEEAFAQAMHISGEMAVRLLVASLFATPLLRIWPRARFPRWLRRNRRTLGVASFAYGALHAGIYIGHRRWPDVVDDLSKATYIAGWLALLVMVPLAMTSFDSSQKRLGKRWIVLHRLAYLAGIAGAAHWLLKPDANTLGPVLVHFLPLALLEANRARLLMKEPAE